LRPDKVLRYLRAACAVAAVAGALALAAAWLEGSAGRAWLLFGWTPMAALGLAGGLWVAARHGRPGPGFIVALLAGMLARLAVAGTGVGLAAFAGGTALRAHLEGLALGFVPLQVHEALFFWREVRAPAGEARSR
jgi:hypothetical protein